MENNAGVYTIQNTISGKKYIGSARLIRRRFSQHRTALRGKYHQNKHLQAIKNPATYAGFYLNKLQGE